MTDQDIFWAKVAEAQLPKGTVSSRSKGEMKAAQDWKGTIPDTAHPMPRHFGPKALRKELARKSLAMK